MFALSRLTTLLALGARTRATRITTPNLRVQTQPIYCRPYSQAPSVVLRPYQEACIESCVEALNSGVSRIGVSAPTGSGKTTIFVSLISRLPTPPNRPSATRAIVIVNSIELAKQAAQQVKTMCPDLSVEVEQGQRYKASGAADVTVATYQTLMGSRRLAKFDPTTIKAVIVDEAHHAAAPSYIRVLSHFDPSIRASFLRDETQTANDTLDVPSIIGFSATFSRHDGLALGKVFQRIVYHSDFLDMIKEQWLCNVRFTSVHANLDLTSVTINTRSGDFNPTSLAHVINTDTINDLVFKTWLDRAATRKSTLIFCVNIAHVRDLTNKFREYGVDARYLYSGTPAFERRVLIQEFREGKYPVLVNCAILTEGADIPNIDCVIVARPTRSRNLFAQMIGRGMRLSPGTGKEDCRIIDFVDAIHRVGGVVSTPTLFGLDPDILVDDETPASLAERAESALSPGKSSQAPDIPKPKSVFYTDYEDPLSITPNSYVTQLSPHTWVACGDDVFVLECMGKGYLKVTKNEDGEGFVAHFVPAAADREEASVLGMKSPYFRKRQIAVADTVDAAVKACDTYALNKVVFGRLVSGLLQRAPWRRAPATDNQKKFIAKRLKISLEDGEVTQPDDTAISSSPLADPKRRISLATLTKGQAADIIIRLKHGAMARYDKKKRKSAKEALIEEKERARRERETVRVGPLPQAA
ncbi:hypothetical protein BOTBODRAFT_30973 [Botryobasidium botryosum FD-172 SS1]|uniref:P-loop containing nucleoside triphosphate hydrolase protein n=1 Tax=Botryobasidium botryosum (strain FD-172 SS1) TaxID=930990 RepID=A0A067MKI0_BOTB1|nr:hypothetical protein BOTBODRAFT_30973 [Botryobasidium botryosum FD-172 SS1]